MDVGNENHNSGSGDRSPRTYKERDGEIDPKDPWEHPNQIPTEKKQKITLLEHLMS